ncbi:energy transducer TonB [Fulvivirga sedimenti]
MLPLQKPAQEPSLIISHKNTRKVYERADFVGDLIRLKRQRYEEFKTRKMLFASIGLLVSMLAIVTLFNWKFYDRADNIDLQANISQVEELLDIPVTEQPPPPPKKVIQQPNIVEVSEEEIIEEIEINLDMEITEDMEIEEVIIENMDAPEEEHADEIFLIVEQAPEPVGGMQSFMTYLAENLQYPSKALRMQISGRVYVQFVVNADGSLQDFLVVKGIGGGCDEEAVRVLKSAPKWIPGKQRGKTVRVRMVIPVYFMIKE